MAKWFFMFFLSMSQCFAEAVISLWMSVKARFQTVAQILNHSCEAVTSATASGPLTSEAKLKGECEARVRELQEVSCE